MDKKTETFLNELRNLNNYKHRLKELEDKLDTLFYNLTGVKAVRYDLVKGMSDYQQIELIKLGKIDEYNGQKEVIDKEISRLKSNISYIETVLNKMEPSIKEACIQIYCHNKTYKQVASTMFISSSALYKKVENEIKKVKNY